MYLTPRMIQTDYSSSPKPKIQFLQGKEEKYISQTLYLKGLREITLVTWENNQDEITAKEGHLLNERPRTNSIHSKPSLDTVQCSP